MKKEIQRQVASGVCAICQNPFHTYTVMATAVCKLDWCSDCWDKYANFGTLPEDR